MELGYNSDFWSSCKCGRGWGTYKYVVNMYNETGGGVWGVGEWTCAW